MRAATTFDQNDKLNALINVIRKHPLAFSERSITEPANSVSAKRANEYIRDILLDGEEGKQALDEALRISISAMSSSPGIVQVLLEAGAGSNSVALGRVLVWAAVRGYVDVINSVLLRENIRPSDVQLAFTTASIDNRYEDVINLLSSRSEIDDNTRETVAHRKRLEKAYDAARTMWDMRFFDNEDYKRVIELLYMGERENLAPNLDKALRLAVEANNVPLIRSLLQIWTNADRGLVSRDGPGLKGVFTWAYFEGHRDIIEEISSVENAISAELLERIRKIENELRVIRGRVYMQTMQYKKIIELVETGGQQNLDEALRLAVTIDSVPMVQAILQIRMKEGDVSYDSSGLRGAFIWASIEGHNAIINTISSIEGFDTEASRRELEERAKKISVALEIIESEAKNELGVIFTKEMAQEVINLVATGRFRNLDIALNSAVKWNNPVLVRAILQISADEIRYAGEGASGALRWGAEKSFIDVVNMILSKKEHEVNVSEKCREVLVEIEAQSNNGYYGYNDGRILPTAILEAARGSAGLSFREDLAEGNGRTGMMYLAMKEETLPLLEEFIPNSTQRRNFIEAVKAIEFLGLAYSDNNRGSTEFLTIDLLTRLMSEVDFPDKEIFQETNEKIRNGNFVINSRNEEGEGNKIFKIRHVGYREHAAYFVIQYNESGQPIELSYIDGNCPLSPVIEGSRYRSGVVTFKIEASKIADKGLDSPERFEQYLENSSKEKTINSLLAGIVECDAAGTPQIIAEAIPVVPQKRGNCTLKAFNILERYVTELSHPEMRFGDREPAGRGAEAYKICKHNIIEKSLNVLMNLKSLPQSQRFIPIKNIQSTLAECSLHAVAKKVRRNDVPSSTPQNLVLETLVGGAEIVVRG